MSQSTHTSIDFSDRHIRQAARLSFIFVGMGMAIWGALIPFLKVNLNVNEAVLGLLLLCVGLGGLIAMPFAGAMASRFGCKHTLQIVIPLEFLVLVGVTFIENIWLAAIACLLKGIAVGIADVVINIQAVFIEKWSSRKLMSNMHAMFSAGSIIGALGMVGLLSIGITPSYAVGALACIVCAIVYVYCRRYFLPFGSEEGENNKNSNGKAQKKHGITLPKGIVIFIGSLCFLLYMNEGVLLDWAALFLVEEHNTPIAQATLAFAIFSAATVVGRLLGDRIVQIFGVLKVLVLGALMSALGHGIVLYAPSTMGAFVGFALVGLGAANLVPQLFSFSAKQQTMPTHMAIAAITMLGFLGVLVGPAMMGFVAESCTLPAVFGLMSFFLCIIAAVAPLLVKKLS